VPAGSETTLEEVERDDVEAGATAARVVVTAALALETAGEVTCAAATGVTALMVEVALVTVTNSVEAAEQTDSADVVIDATETGVAVFEDAFAELVLLENLVKLLLLVLSEEEDTTALAVVAGELAALATLETLAALATAVAAACAV
jgi:hypothetical protein